MTYRYDTMINWIVVMEYW